MNKYEDLRSVIENYELRDYEKTSLDYCKIVLFSQKRGGVILIYSGNELEKSAVIRDLEVLNIEVEKCITETEFAESFSESEPLLKSSGIVISTVDITQLLYKIASHRKTMLSKWIERLRRWFEIGEDNNWVSSYILKIDVPYWRLRREEIFDFAKDNIGELCEFYDQLGDDESRRTLYEIVRCSAENDCYAIKQRTQFEKYWECYSHKEDEVWVNCGSATGDTIIKFLHQGYDFKKIYAYEGSETEYKNLEEVLGLLPNEIRIKIDSNNSYIGIDDGDNNFDHIFKDIPVSLINMDIEGAEMGVLQGAKKLIREKRPVLAICAYHKATDLLDIPKLINEVVDDYVFFVRKYIGFEINALNEYVYYAVPKERTIS